ncbi:MAG: TAT-variant-translocated molybdopterin oxidoreductase [Chitinophagaceae bacterium]|nr:TAT-variant-translocated molybdopterin oxidoreductase [Chitinophagaceae bacterium]
MSKSTIWQSFGQRNQTEAFEELGQDEFREDLPMELDDKGILDAKTPRRDFLKYLGFSTAAASLAASCEMPVKTAIPFVNKPDNVVPGVANYYATTFTQDGDVLSVIAKVRDGRPIKIEGNDMSPITQGGTSARAQASVLDLYDTRRLRFPAQIVDGKTQEIPTFEAFDKTINEKLASLGGAPVVILTSTITSPSTKKLVGEFIAKYPGSRHVTYDAVSYSGMLLANEATFGNRAIPSYHFDNAKVIVSLGADFLGTWLSPVEFSKQYSKGRKINEEKVELSKHYQFESILSMTGANADERFTHKPSQEGVVAAALYNLVTGAGASGVDEKLKAGLEKVAKDLKAANGEALVVSGSNNTNVQILVNAINSAIGAYGKTINWSVTSNYKQGVDGDMAQLVADMNAGSVGALFILDANPSYDYPAAGKFNEGLKKVKLSISFNAKLDETTQLCQYSLPNNHYLESWGDAEAKSGYQSFIQPTIHPLFKTRQWQDSLLKWSGSTKDYATYLKEYWMEQVGSIENWDAALRVGVRYPGEVSVSAGSFNGAAVSAALSACSVAPQAGKWEVVLYQKVGIGTGSQASNPWLQELPDPVTKATWDNYAMISAAAANELFGIDIRKNGDSDSYEVNPGKPVIKIKANGQELELPILIIPGTEKNTIGIALGYGRHNKVGIAVRGVGKNVYPLASVSASGNRVYMVANAEVEKTGEKYEVAQNQVYNYYIDSLGVKRVEVVKETSLASFKANPEKFKHERDHLFEDYAKKSGDYRNEGSLYDPRLNDRPGIHWGMSIDLNTCTGCGACVVACNAENNIPVVGKKEVMRGHEMHWLRIDRYYVNKPGGDPDDLADVVFMPMMCQHCDNAPCENVCPVAATNHSSEGLNQMTYNRCIGTRYCANNCPYKVRRFNWADYTGADSFSDNQVGIISKVTLDMNDDLTRMVLNPDVTVRSRGVIEKCSFCVQRLQEGKLTAKKEGRPVKDGEVKTACQSACPTNAIVFGDANDKESMLTKSREHSPLRMYYALEQIHVLPNVNYLAKIRNTDEVEEHAGHGHAEEAAHG